MIKLSTEIPNAFAIFVVIVLISFLGCFLFLDIGLAKFKIEHLARRSPPLPSRALARRSSPMPSRALARRSSPMRIFWRTLSYRRQASSSRRRTLSRRSFGEARLRSYELRRSEARLRSYELRRSEGGESGIRTHARKTSHVLQTCALSHSAISPHFYFVISSLLILSSKGGCVSNNLVNQDFLLFPRKGEAINK